MVGKLDFPCTLLLGAQGRLGGALVDALKALQQTVLMVPRKVYASWSTPEGEGHAYKFFTASVPPGSLLLNACGLLDPAESMQSLIAVNERLAVNAARGITAFGGTSVSFGTVMERILPPDQMNPYVYSKWRLGNWAASAASGGMAALHLQLHTLYGGGPPAPFMFLGQALAAIREHTPFKMTAGTQLREYHHVEDDARAILHLANIGLLGCVTLSHGESVSLRQLASSVFSAFGCEHLLQIGALPSPPVENYDVGFNRLPDLDGMAFRGTINGVISWMRSLMPVATTRTG
jgi:hypothetical protein